MQSLLNDSMISIKMDRDTEKRVLKRIRPTARESEMIESAASRVVDGVNSESPRYFSEVGGKITPVIVGSVAKGTYLKEADVDVFMTFPVTAGRDVLEKVGLELGRKVLDKPVVKYAEHPYIRGVMGGVNIDLVPCYAVEDPGMKMSAVDRTPFQSRYVNSKIEQFQRDEVRLLKRFFKGIGVYGAEARVNGFSGYLTELLVLSYGTFAATVNSISRWKRGEVVIVPGTKLGAKLEGSDALLTLPDPVDADRNVAAALGPDAFSIAVMACHRYVRRADIRFFFPVQQPPADLPSIKRAISESGHGLLLLTIAKPDVVDDNLYPQIQKAKRNIISLLNKHEFVVNRTAFSVDGKIKILFEMRQRTYPSSWLRAGPEGWSSNSPVFIDKHRKAGGSVSLVDGVLYSEEKKPFATPGRLLENSIGELSLGADIDGMKHTAEVSSDAAVIDAGNRALLSSLLFYRFPWEY